jgi:hypothetical protein
MPREVEFLNPFQGKKSDREKSGFLELAGLFLIDPRVVAKLLGISVRTLFQKEGMGRLYRQINKPEPGNGVTSTDILLREAGRLKGVTPFQLRFRAAVTDIADRGLLGKMSPWEAFIRGAETDGYVITLHDQLLLDIEQACKEPLKLLEQGCVNEGTQLLLSDPLMQHFLWPEAVQALSNYNMPGWCIALQHAVAFEIWLSRLALRDVSLQKDGEGSLFSCLLPTPDDPGRNPTGRLFAWMKEAVDARTIKEMLDGKADHLSGFAATPDLSEDSTYKRWSSNVNKPTVKSLAKFASHWFNDPQYPPLMQRHSASRELNFIGFHARQIQEKVLAIEPTQMRIAWAPWPKLPFNHETVESWMAARYPVWLDFHRARLAQSSLASGSGP